MVLESEPNRWSVVTVLPGTNMMVSKRPHDVGTGTPQISTFFHQVTGM